MNVRGNRGRGARLVLLVLALVLSWHLVPGSRRSTLPSHDSHLARWLGPVADLARDIQWIRYQRALLAGDHLGAVAHAEGALAFDPGSTEGWQLLASHFAFFRASPEREPDPERRRAWFRAGVHATESGAIVARDPSELHFLRGLMYLSKLEVDPALLPGGAPELRRSARRAFEEAAAAGHAHASEMLKNLRGE